MQINLLDSVLEKFIKTLEKPTIAKMVRTIELLEQFGNQLGMPTVKRSGKDYLSYVCMDNRKL